MNGFLKQLFGAAFLCTALLGVHPASATILWAGGEEMDFTLEGSSGMGTHTNGSYIDSTFSRQGVYLNAGGEFLKTGVFANSSLFWVHFLYASSSCTANADWIKFADSAGVDRIVFRPTASSAAPPISMNKRNSAGTVTLLGTSAGNANVGSSPFHTFDIFINYAAAGQITIYMDGNQLVTYSGDVTTDSQTSLAQVKLGNCRDSFSWSTYSQVIVSTTDSRNMRLLTRAPVANGNTMAWTGAVSDINENTLSDLNLISSGTAGQIAQFTVPATLPVSGSWSVQAVVQSGRLLRSATGPQNFRFSLRTGGVDYTSPGDILLGLVYGNYNYVWNTNPNTGAAWTSSQVTAATFNLGVKSQP